MVSITLSVPEEMKKEMDERPEMNWSEIARQAIRHKLDLLDKLDIIMSKSKLTEEDAIELGRKVNKKAAARYK
jgi:metal-responsive CopG/Arc/MetJ family transcriptional regulator